MFNELFLINCPICRKLLRKPDFQAVSSEYFLMERDKINPNQTQEIKSEPPNPNPTMELQPEIKELI